MIIADKKLDKSIIAKLTQIDDIFLLSTQGITYEAISGHPDVFFCQVDGCLISAPNLPPLPFATQTGKMQVGRSYPASAVYNAVVTHKYLIHNLRITDKVIVEKTHNKIKIDVNQGYTRCNLLVLNDELFITSDKGIEAELRKHNLVTLYFNPSAIVLPGYNHGFFGGCCGIISNTVLFTGSLQFHTGGNELKKRIKEQGFEVLELLDAPLYDGGSIICV